MTARPQLVGLEGFIYLIEFDSNRIKPGFTASPERRLSEHKRTASCYGVEVGQVWHSPFHGHARVSETTLLAFCSDYPGAAAFGEFFANVPFAEALAFAQTLDYEPREAPLLQVVARPDEPIGPTVFMGETCARLNLPRPAVVELIENGDLREVPRTHSSSHRRISVASIEAYATRQAASGAEIHAQQGDRR